MNGPVSLFGLASKDSSLNKRFRSLAAVAVLALSMALSACGPNSTAPVPVMAMVYSATNQYGPQKTQLNTVTDVTALKGTAVNFVGGASIILDPMDPAQANLNGLSSRQIADAFLRSRGGDVHVNLIDRGGVYWPGDFHSWAMVTAYWNFEQSLAYFTKVYGTEKTDKLNGTEVLYWGEFRDLSVKDPEEQAVVDNFFYFLITRQFVIPPFKEVQKVPVSMNLAIVGHEFSHRVFSQKAYGDQTLVAELNWTGAPFKIIRSLDEGLADFHAYGITCVTPQGPGCRTKFLSQSFEDAIATKRDFSRGDETCMSAQLRTALINLDDANFIAQGKQYELGTLFAAALYQAANKGGKLELMQKAVIRSYDDDSSLNPGLRQLFQSNLNTSGNVNLESISDTIISHITDPELQEQTCSELWDRLDLHPEQRPMPHCPNTAARGSTCPVLPQ